MQTRREFNDARALFDEAIAIYEAAKREFEALQATLQRSYRLQPQRVAELERAADAARAKLFFVRVRVFGRGMPLTPMPDQAGQ